MPDNVPVTPGSGINIRTDTLTDPVTMVETQAQYIKILNGQAGDDTHLVVNPRNGIYVEGPDATAEPVTGHPLHLGGLVRNALANPRFTDATMGPLSVSNTGFLRTEQNHRSQRKQYYESWALSAAEKTIAPAVASRSNELVSITIANYDPVSRSFILRDATGGPTRWAFIIPTEETRQFRWDVSAPLFPAASNTNWTLQPTATVTLCTALVTYLEW